MEQISYLANLISFALIILLWFVFAGLFLFRKMPATKPDKIGVPSSFIGLALQGVGFGLVWAFRRTPVFSPFAAEYYILNIALQVLAIAMSAGSVCLAMFAIKELGKQWSLEARLIEDHKLVKTGVYQITRHPIYTAMLGMLISTGFAFSHWIALVVATIVFLIGTKIRTNIEENLLVDAFGPEFDEWKARVPGLIPFAKF